MLSSSSLMHGLFSPIQLRNLITIKIYRFLLVLIYRFLVGFNKISYRFEEPVLVLEMGLVLDLDRVPVHGTVLLLLEMK
jgi:hypothetical protein